MDELIKTLQRDYPAVDPDIVKTAVQNDVLFIHVMWRRPNDTTWSNDTVVEHAAVRKFAISDEQLVEVVASLNAPEASTKGEGVTRAAYEIVAHTTMCMISGQRELMSDLVLQVLFATIRRLVPTFRGICVGVQITADDTLVHYPTPAFVWVDRAGTPHLTQEHIQRQ